MKTTLKEKLDEKVTKGNSEELERKIKEIFQGPESTVFIKYDSIGNCCYALERGYTYKRFPFKYDGRTMKETVERLEKEGITVVVLEYPEVKTTEVEAPEKDTVKTEKTETEAVGNFRQEIMDYFLAESFLELRKGRTLHVWYGIYGELRHSFERGYASSEFKNEYSEGTLEAVIPFMEAEGMRVKVEKEDPLEVSFSYIP